MNSIAKGSKVPVVKTWNQASDLQMSTAFSQKAEHNRTQVIGSEFLGRITAGSTEAGFEATALGEVLYRQPLSPLMLNGTRVKKFAEMFQTYETRHMSVHFVPLVPATQNGGVVFTPLYDPDMAITHIPNGDELNRILLSMEESQYANVYQPISVIWSENILKSLFTRVEDSDVRLQVPGDILVTSGSSYSPFDGSATSIPLYGIWLTYDIVFHNRGLIETDANLGEATFTTGALPVAANTVFYYSGATVPGNSPVCLQPSLTSLAPFRNNDYVLMAYVLGIDGAGQPNWNFAVYGDVALVHDGSEGEFLMTRGKQFYISYHRTETSECFILTTNLTSALESRPDIYWGPTMDGQSVVQDCNISFKVLALPR